MLPTEKTLYLLKSGALEALKILLDSNPETRNWNDPKIEPSKHLIHVKELVRTGKIVETYDYLVTNMLDMLISNNNLEREFVQKYIHGIEKEDDEEVVEAPKSLMDQFLEDYEEEA